MKIINCTLTNFASYKNLVFDFQNQGLALIQGPTGAGKSTLCDAIPWILFGRTAKDGAVDEVLSWNAEGPTTGIITFEISGHIHTISRHRNPNDLIIYYAQDLGRSTRGKDLNDTQKLINNLIGADVSTYLASSYFHEFSQTAQFFTTTAKNRRVICEQLVDLSLAKTLQIKLQVSKKDLESLINTYNLELDIYADRIKTLEAVDYDQKYKEFEIKQQNRITVIKNEIKNLKSQIRGNISNDDIKLLETEKKALINDKCTECGSPKHVNKVLEFTQTISNMHASNAVEQRTAEKIRAYTKEISNIEKEENTYGEIEIKRKNYLSEAVTERDALVIKHAKANTQYNDLLLLSEVINSYRTASISSAIKQLETNTNKLLNDHYDAEIRVQFEVDDADKIDVTIIKDSNLCSFTQLSKGQRQLLKLSFGVSIMRMAANHSGVSFNTLWFDEAVDGMDDNFRVKTFRLFEELALEYESVFVVDHSEALKSMFINKYAVSLINEHSQIEKS